MANDRLTILDIFKAISMQISIWRWEARMIAKFGLDWGYKEPFEIIETGEPRSNTERSHQEPACISIRNMKELLKI